MTDRNPMTGYVARLLRLIECADLPNVTIQLAPFRAGVYPASTLARSPSSISLRTTSTAALRPPCTKNEGATVMPQQTENFLVRRYPGIPPRDLDAHVYSTELDEPYRPGPESERQPDRPVGALTSGTMSSTTVYPGRSYGYTVYVADQYDGERPANLVVFLDGGLYLEAPFNAPVVLDNLIAGGDLPPVVALFVDPGSPGPGMPIYGGEGNRSLEYDSVSDDYVRFLLDELLPPVEDAYSVTEDPAGRAICGFSSSGNAAFTAAWHRPDRFGRVISHLGSFVAIRGGDTYASLVRREDAKPIRVFLQTGRRDLNTVFGSWRLANETLASSLAYRDYDHRLVVGEGGHTPMHGATILPETLRWVFRH